MKKVKNISALMSAVMCVSMFMTPVSVLADDTAAPEETQTVEEQKNEEEEPEVTEDEDESEAEAKRDAEDAYLAKGKCGKKLKWTLDKNGTLKITGKGAMYNFKYDNKNNTTDSPWDKYRSSIKKAVISKGVTTIGNNAFMEFGSLASVSLPKTLKTIGIASFGCCYSLTGITFPKKLTKIGGSCFWQCTALKSVNIPNGVTAINDFAFYSCSALEKAVIPASVKTIGKNAFYYCKSLTVITIPASVKEIGNDAFSYCYGLESVNIPLVGLTTIGTYAFANCEGLKEFTVPLSVTDLGDYAFFKCTGLEEVTISQTLNDHLSAHVFDGCTNLTKPTVSKYLGIYEYFFDDGNNNVFVVLSPNINGTGTVLMMIINEAPESLAVPNFAVHDGVKYKIIGVVASYRSYLKNVKKLVLGSNVVSINDENFAGCPELVSVTGGAGLETIGARAFANCPKLKTFNITSKKLKKIGANAFDIDKALMTLQLKKTTKLTKAGVKNALKGSSVKTVKVKKSKVKKYKKIFKKKNCGKKVKVKK